MFLGDFLSLCVCGVCVGGVVAGVYGRGWSMGGGGGGLDRKHAGQLEQHDRIPMVVYSVIKIPTNKGHHYSNLKTWMQDDIHYIFTNMPKF